MSPIITKTQYEYLNGRINKMTGFDKKIGSIQTLKDILKIEIRLIKNEINTINKRLDKIDKKLKGRWR